MIIQSVLKQIKIHAINVCCNADFVAHEVSQSQGVVCVEFYNQHTAKQASPESPVSPVSGNTKLKCLI